MARGHFHERVGESPVREEHFDNSGFQVSFFVSEISESKNIELVNHIYNSKILPLLNA